MAQTRWVVGQLEEANAGEKFEIRTISTRGDTDARPLFAIDQKGIFEKEIDAKVALGEVDFAVHSMKDVPSEIPEGLVLACVPRRAMPGDVLVTKDGLGIESLRRGAEVGTSSLRRAVQVSRARPDVRVNPVRGNVDTRVSLVRRGELDAVILARAGLARLGIEADVGFADLGLESFVPSPGQGALALVARADDAQTVALLRTIEDAGSRAEADAERALSEAIGSGCRFPVGAHASFSKDSITVRAVAFSVDGSERIEAESTGSAADAAGVGRRAGAILRERGVERLAFNWREKVAEWNSR